MDGRGRRRIMTSLSDPKEREIECRSDITTIVYELTKFPWLNMVRMIPINHGNEFPATVFQYPAFTVVRERGE